MSCNNTSPIIRSSIGSKSLHHRTGFDSCGFGTHGGTHNEEFNSTFHSSCTSWINYFSGLAGWPVDWVGDVGVLSCRPPSLHAQARALDLTRIQNPNGAFIDMNTHWNPSNSCINGNLGFVRHYIAVAASLRRYVGTVLTAWYNSDHHNHIHFDNGTSVGPIRTTARTDATLIQAVCRYMNNESIVIDGDWGPATEGAYGRLLTKVRMQCKNPKGNTSDALLLLDRIVQSAIRGQTVGGFVGPC